MRFTEPPSETATGAVGKEIMLGWSLCFLIVAILAGLLGFTGIAGMAAWIAKILFFLFLILFVLSLILGRGTRI